MDVENIDSFVVCVCSVKEDFAFCHLEDMDVICSKEAV